MLGAINLVGSSEFKNQCAIRPLRVVDNSANFNLNLLCLSQVYIPSFNKMLLEVCVENPESALNAINGGAKRLEICTSLELGGLTPSMGLFKVIKKLTPSDCKLFVMIRPRPGNFTYTDYELQVMLENIKLFKSQKVDGFVFGCLKKDRRIDEPACKQLLKAASPTPCTFHRAFDMSRDPEESIQVLAQLGFSRVLTSGYKETAYLGKDLIKLLVDKVDQLGANLIVVPGGGIRPNNLKEILETTKCKEFHSSAREGNEHQEEKERGWLSKASVVKEILQVARSVNI